jgi:hypothetical protein
LKLFFVLDEKEKFRAADNGTRAKDMIPVRDSCIVVDIRAFISLCCNLM